MIPWYTKYLSMPLAGSQFHEKGELECLLASPHQKENHPTPTGTQKTNIIIITIMIISNLMNIVFLSIIPSESRGSSKVKSL
jgi:hypothetical protein